MAEDTQLEHAVPPTRPVAGAPTEVGRYARHIPREQELVDLILALEAIAAGERPDPTSHVPLGRLTAATGLDLGDPAAVTAAILTLGARAEALAGLRREVGTPRPLSGTGVDAITQGLIGCLESARDRWAGREDFEARLHAEAEAALAVYQQDATLTTHGDAGWWEALSETVHQRLVPAYARLALDLTRVEDHPIQGALLRSRPLMAALVAAPILLTIPMPVPTGALALMTALFGGLIVHPAWVRHLAGPLRTLTAAMARVGSLLDRRAGRAPWREEDFSVAGVLEDVTPHLEAARLAERASEPELREVIDAHLTALEGPFEAHSQRSPRYLHHLRSLFEGVVVQRWARHSAARRRLEGTVAGMVLDRPWLSGLTLALITLPIDLLASRVSPLPQPVDLPILFGLFAALGASLPRTLPGTLPSKEHMEEELRERQTELDQLP